MTLLDSLLDAIVRLEGDALVMHVGEKPYVVTTSSSMNTYRGPLAWGQVELSSRVLTPDAVLSMVEQILPADQRHALEELGAVEHEITSPAGVANRFSVVAARGGDDIWLELRRHPPTSTESPVEATAPAAGAVAASESTTTGTTELPAATAVGLQDPHATRVDAAFKERVPVIDEVAQHEPEHVEHITIPLTEETAASAHEGEPALEVVEPEAQLAPTDEEVDSMLAATAAALLSADSISQSADLQDAVTEHDPELPAGVETAEMFDVIVEEEDVQESRQQSDSYEDDSVDLTAALDEMPVAARSPMPPAIAAPPVPMAEAAYAWAETKPADASPAPVTESDAPVLSAGRAEPEFATAVQETHVFAGDSAIEEPSAAGPVSSEPPSGGPAENTLIPVEKPLEKPAARPVVDSQPPVPTPATIAASPHNVAPRVVVPIGYAAAKAERPDAGARVDDETLLQTLHVAAERGASTVYVVAQSKPMLRVDGEISALDDGPTLTTADIQRLATKLAPPSAGSLADGVEWISEVPQVGRVRCVTFHDHRGPGIIFRLTSLKSISAEHLSLSPEIRDLAALPDGLVIVTGARGSGKSILLNSFVDLINRSRGDHVITVETEIAFVHDSRRSFVSQREVGDAASAVVAAIGAALKEDPDVLFIEDLQSGDAVLAALHAAESGRLVFASVTAPSSAAALEALVNMVPAAERASVRATLSGVLRGVVAQVLLRKASGGRVAVRELLLNSPAVAASIHEGEGSGLAAALASGQRHGMVPLNDSLAALVRGGAVHGTEAYRRAPDRAALLACLARDGVDTTFAERLA